MGVVRTMLAGTAIAVLMANATLAAPASAPAREAAFDAAISSADQIAWLKDMSSAPNHVGSPHDKANAETVLGQFKSWGWDAHIETFQVLYPTPISTTLEMIAPEKVTLGGQEPPVPGDDTSYQTKDALPPYFAYQGDGDVTAPVIYLNYGMPADYDALARHGLDVKGKIVIARYGQGWRGLKVKLAQDHGAVGCLVYSDPADDGYGTHDSYPRGGGRSANGVQRGSVEDNSFFPGDPLTPGVGATPDAKRLTRAESPALLRIPALPISYADASKLMAGLEGPMVPENARGGLPFAYHYGGTGAVTAHLAVQSDWSQKTVYDVIATLKGKTKPDEWVIRGNHRDAWVFGAADPLSGQVAMLSEAKAMGGLVKAGWRPDRTIVYASWDGEEPGLLGSTEWAETHAVELKRKAVLYINTDDNDRGTLYAEGNHDLQHFVGQVMGDVTDPETGATLAERSRATILAREYDKPGSQKAEDIAAAKTGGDMLLYPPGSGSDYATFVDHLGLPVLSLGFTGEGATGGSYHSVYDSFHHYTTFDDPGLRYGVALSKTVGRLVLRAADAPRVPARYGDFATAIARYVGEVKTLAEGQRTKDRARALATADGVFRLASNPDNPTTAPADKGITPLVDMLALENASDRLTKSARAADAMLGRFDGLDAARQTRIEQSLKDIDQTLIDPAGLPIRPWYANLIYAPGRFTGYGAKTLPGIREAIEERRWADATAYVGKTAAVLNAYSDRLDAAVAASK